MKAAEQWRPWTKSSQVDCSHQQDIPHMNKSQWVTTHQQNQYNSHWTYSRMDHRQQACPKSWAQALEGRFPCHPEDFYPHLLKPTPGGKLEDALKSWSIYSKEAIRCSRMREWVILIGKCMSFPTSHTLLNKARGGLMRNFKLMIWNEESKWLSFAWSETVCGRWEKSIAWTKCLKAHRERTLKLGFALWPSLRTL